MTSMMKTWRERIADAREHGKFTPEDRAHAFEHETCMIGECKDRFGVDLLGFDLQPRIYEYRYASVQFLAAIQRNDYSAAEKIMEAMEDHALQLKREAK